MDLTGKIFSNYRIEGKLGAGGMGEVYLGVHPVLNKQVAIKVLPPEFASHSTLVKRFHQEARIMATLKHPNIVAVENMGEHEGLYYIVMEYVDGESLGQLLKHEGKIEYNKAIDIITQVCSALSYAHKDNIIHRDIKPSNILIGKDNVVKVTDFGIAKIVGDTALSVGDLSTAISKGLIDRDETGSVTTSDLTHSASTPGTIAYMSPEQIEGRTLTSSSDLYSLGVVFYEMLVGKRPIGRFKLPSQIDETIPKEINIVVEKLLFSEKEDRCQDGNEVVEHLSGIKDVRQIRKKKKAERMGSAKPGVRRRKTREIEIARAEVKKQEEELLETKEVRSNQKFLDMIYVPAGEFLMESLAVKDKSTKPKLAINPFGEFLRINLGIAGKNIGKSEEHPTHRVYLDAYYIDKYEVTVGQYRKFCEASGKSMPIAPSWGWIDSHPMVNVTWNDAVAYAEYYGKRLPTEAEWEKACRAGSTTRYCYGEAESSLGEYAWYSSNSGGRTQPVGQKKPNAWGLYDMHGNVWEWCSDWYGEGYYKNSPSNNPKGLGSGTCRVLRGGSWDCTPDGCRSALRGWGLPTNWADHRGFRCAVAASQ